MARYIDLLCNECDSEVEVYCDGDNAMICPECRSIDCFKEIEEKNDDTSMDS
jgi:virulence-associated protein VagC